MRKPMKNKIYIPITKAIQDIIDQYGNKAVGHDAFIFPILRPEWDEEKDILCHPTIYQND